MTNASTFPDDIFAEPADVDPITLSNLGPLRPLVGIWSGTLTKIGEPTPNPLAQK